MTEESKEEKYRQVLIDIKPFYAVFALDEEEFDIMLTKEEALEIRDGNGYCFCHISKERLAEIAKVFEEVGDK